ncbi:hypothetical protein SSAG_00181 [Streptomyces sp. Mg1]|nr:hypothetical protein SSAG_00181 [Streptomyces sp. Mg1]
MVPCEAAATLTMTVVGGSDAYPGRVAVNGAFRWFSAPGGM